MSLASASRTCFIPIRVWLQQFFLDVEREHLRVGPDYAMLIP